MAPTSGSGTGSPAAATSAGGIVTVEQADTYFGARLNASTYWTSATAKAAALNTATLQLATEYTLDEDTELHRNAVCEQALFLLMSGEGVDRRAQLQAMGVTKAGKVAEDYKADGMVAICPYAKRTLKDVRTNTAGATILSADLTRDDDA